ncbi:MAG: hypothetical protein KDC44_24495, partial [Phaeodactylibacter sp.]|nr:hypothetical protein [Phaeodactylibacter sp.]
MKTLIATFFFSGISFLLLAQNGNAPLAGARGAGMAGTGLVIEDIYSSFSNQAGLAFLDGFAGGVTAEQRFQLQEIQLVGAAAAYPTGSGTFGLALSYFGFEAYNEQKIGLNYARLLTDNLSLGAQLNYLTTRIPNYGSAGTLSFELGLQARIGEYLRL